MDCVSDSISPHSSYWMLDLDLVSLAQDLLAGTLLELHITGCSRIFDFSPVSMLHNLKVSLSNRYCQII